jgi:hypothetical protein
MSPTQDDLDIERAAGEGMICEPKDTAHIPREVVKRQRCFYEQLVRVFQRPDRDPLRKPPREHPAVLLKRGDAADEEIRAAHKYYASELHCIDENASRNDPSNIESRLKIGTVVRSTRPPYPGFLGKVVGWDEDLRLPLIVWGGAWASIGWEACEPDEYDVVGGVADLDEEIKAYQESDESLRDRRDDLRKDGEDDSAIEREERHV